MGCCGSKQGAYAAPREVATKWFHSFEDGIPSLKDKVICVTGCTTGTGYVCARTCARKGAHVVMLNRKSARSAAAKLKLAEEAPGSQVTSIECDLMSFESVRACCASLTSQFKDQGIDVLCCNAGVMALADEATKDGYDVQMQTNHLSHFLLVKELMPLLETAAGLRGEARRGSSTTRALPGMAAT